MDKALKAIASFLFLVLASLPTGASCAGEVVGPDVRLAEKKIFVAASLRLDAGHLGEIEKGASKEIVVYIDLFRIWKNWPDEFVLGRTVTRTLKCDPVKKEYTATSLEGSRLVEKRFKDCEGLVSWALAFKETALTSTAELDPAEYFVKVSAESRVVNLPPFVDLLLFFVPETEFKITGESQKFRVN